MRGVVEDESGWVNDESGWVDGRMEGVERVRKRQKREDLG